MSGVPGLSKSRLEALCDGIFTIAMTLLVLEVAIPAREAVHGEAELLSGLLAIWPKLLSYVASFLLLASLWFAHHFEFSFLASTDRRHLWINVGFMLCVSFVPVSTALLGDFYTFRTGVAVYAGNMALAGTMLLWNWLYATGRARLTVEGFPAAVRRGVAVRLGIYAALFVLSAVLSFLSVTAGFVLCVTVPVVYIVLQVIPHPIDEQRQGPATV
jgi:uncharacterized membrane protein